MTQVSAPRNLVADDRETPIVDLAATVVFGPDVECLLESLPKAGCAVLLEARLVVVDLHAAELAEHHA